MLRQTSEGLIFSVWYEDSDGNGLALSPLPTCKIEDPSGTLVVNGENMTARANLTGMYDYAYSPGGTLAAGRWAAVSTTASADAIQKQRPSIIDVGVAGIEDLDAAVSTRLAAADAPDVIFDEPLTGATHNVPTSLGRRIRQLGDPVAATVNDASPTAISFVTTLSSSVDGFYSDQTVLFTTGALAGQVRPAYSYDGATKRLTFEEAWTSAPANGDSFDVIPDHVHPVSQIATGVWAATTRTLTSFGTLLASIVSGVLDELLSGHTVSGSVAESISAAGSAADPLLNSVPGSYSAGTAGYALGKIGTGKVTVVQTVSTTGSLLTLVRGDDYAEENDRSVSFSSEDWPDLTGVTEVKLTARRREVTNTTTPADALLFEQTDREASRVLGESTQTVAFELPTVKTTLLEPGSKTAKFDVQATVGGKIITLVTGTITVIEDQTR